MNVTLPIFQSAPTLEQMKAIDYLDSSISDSGIGYLSEAANGPIYVARTTDMDGYVNILHGNWDTSYSIHYAFILYVKTNINLIRWYYRQATGETVVTRNPWASSVVSYNNNNYIITCPQFSTNNPDNFIITGCWANCPVYSSVADFFATEQPIPYTGVAYPITYSYTNSTVSGPSEAVIGDTVTVSAVPDVGYGITDVSTQILVTNNDIAVPYTWDSANNRITFTMPDPS